MLPLKVSKVRVSNEGEAAACAQPKHAAVSTTRSTEMILIHDGGVGFALLAIEAAVVAAPDAAWALLQRLSNI